MGKKRTANKAEQHRSDTGKRSRVMSRIPKKKISSGIVFVEATFNNTRVLFTEMNGNVVMWVTSTTLGFNSAKKATPYAAAKVADAVAEKMASIGVKEVEIIVKGVGGGRESACAFIFEQGVHRPFHTGQDARSA